MVLVSWKDDWFNGNVIKSDKFPERRFSLQGAEKELRAAGSCMDAIGPYTFCFSRDPGFIYYPRIRYYGCIVSLQQIRPDTYPREAFVIWDGYPVIPPDFDQWESSKEQYGWIRLTRYIKVDDLEKEQGAIPDWSLPKP